MDRDWLEVDHHIHTKYSGHSDPEMSIPRIVEAARAAGLRRIVILEHFPEISPRTRLVEDWRASAADSSVFDKIAADIREVEGELGGLRILRGIEVDADPFRMDGSLMLPDPRGFDVVLLAAHVFPGGSAFWFDNVNLPPTAAMAVVERWFDWMEKVLASAPVHAWAHPGDLIGARSLIDRFDNPLVMLRFGRLFEIAAERNIVFELNELLGRKLPDPVRESYPALLRLARSRGVRFCLATDAHRPDAVGQYLWVPALIRAADLGSRDIVELGPEE